MGQYWIPVNLDKKEFINPHKLGTGLKLWEQLANHPGTGAALIVLCAAEREERGGGDLNLIDNKGEAVTIVGRWAGDRIAFVGDYAEDSDLPAQFNARQIWTKCMGESRDDNWKDISEEVRVVIEQELEGEFQAGVWRHFKYERETK